MPPRGTGLCPASHGAGAALVFVAHSERCEADSGVVSCDDPSGFGPILSDPRSTIIESSLVKVWAASARNCHCPLERRRGAPQNDLWQVLRRPEDLYIPSPFSLDRATFLRSGWTAAAAFSVGRCAPTGVSDMTPPQLCLWVPSGQRGSVRNQASPIQALLSS